MQRQMSRVHTYTAVTCFELYERERNRVEVVLKNSVRSYVCSNSLI